MRGPGRADAPPPPPPPPPPQLPQPPSPGGRGSRRRLDGTSVRAAQAQAPSSGDSHGHRAPARTSASGLAPRSPLPLPPSSDADADADAAAGLRREASIPQEYHQQQQQQQQQQQHHHHHHHQRHHQQVPRSRPGSGPPRSGAYHGLDGFRGSEADFLRLGGSAASVGEGGGGGGGEGGASSSVSDASGSLGYLSGTDSLSGGRLTPMPSPPGSGGLPGSHPGLTGLGLSLGLGLKSHHAAADPEAGGGGAGAGARAGAGGGGSTDPTEPFLVLGMDISHLPRRMQFIYCACGVFSFSLLYGFLQELLAVTICCRQLGLFLAVAQFSGYTFWSYLLREYVNETQAAKGGGGSGGLERGKARFFLGVVGSVFSRGGRGGGPAGEQGGKRGPQRKGTVPVPIALYLGLSLLRAIDLGATNLAMQYVNYPAKTLMKSSRVVFTMFFGVLVSKRRYQRADYGVVALMVTGLSVFMHADANSDAIFDPYGIMLLVLSLSCDGAISNMSESLMNKFRVGQDEFIFRLYSIATAAITVAAAAKGDLAEGARFLLLPGTYDEINLGQAPTWSVPAKVAAVVCFSTMGFFGSSCSAAITKNYGALTMSITSTARKATTLFLSFAFFNNVCTFEHVGGIVLFIAALVMKTLRASRTGNKKGRRSRRRARGSPKPDSGWGAPSIEITSGGGDPVLHQRKNISPHIQAEPAHLQV